MNKIALSLAILMSPFFASAADEAVESDVLKVTNVEVVDSTTLEVFFSNDIDFEDVGTFEFRLTNINDEESEDSGEVDATYSEGSTPASVLFELEEEMLPSTVYELKVAYIFDVDGNTITEDVNSTYDVTTPDVFPVVDEDSEEDVEDEDEYYDEEDEYYDEEAFFQDGEVDEDAEEALNSADEEDVESDEDATLELDAAGLPQTGTQEMLLVLVALLAAAGVVYVRRRA